MKTWLKRLFCTHPRWVWSKTHVGLVTCDRCRKRRKPKDI